VTRVLRDALVGAGAPADVIEGCPSALEALLDVLTGGGWQAGSPLPAV